MAEPGCHGLERAGMVVRLAGEFTDFATSIAKCVRAGYVQTDEVWLNRPVEKQRLRGRIAEGKP